MTLRIAPLTVAGLAVLAALNGWLLAILVADIASGDRDGIAKVEWTPGLSVAAEASAVGKPIDAFKETLAHPIFFKTRDPYVAPPPPPPPAPPAPPPKAVAPPPPIVDPGFGVGGVMIKPDTREAYLFTKADPHGTWVSEGESFSGWKVQSVDRAGARLQLQDRSIEVLLYPRD